MTPIIIINIFIGIGLISWFFITFLQIITIKVQYDHSVVLKAHLNFNQPTQSPLILKEDTGGNLQVLRVRRSSLSSKQ